MANGEDDKKKKGTDISSLLFPAVEAARKREQAYLKSNPKNSDEPEGFERLNSANVNASARLYQSHYRDDPWRDESKGMANSPLYSHLPGRLGMRMFTRGVMGATFMAVGSSLTRTYDWHAMEESYKALKSLDNNATLMWAEQHGAHRFVYHIGKAIDKTAGRAIFNAGKAYYKTGKHKVPHITGDATERIALSDGQAEHLANRWVTFRGKMNYSKSSLGKHDEEFAKLRKTYDADTNKAPVSFEFWEPEKGVTKTKELYNELLGKNKIPLPEFHHWNTTVNQNYENGFILTPITRQFNSFEEKFRGTSGQTLGEEIVRVTADFAMGSAGDALGMEMFSYVDPNVKKDWLDKDGFHADKLAKDVGRSLWTVATYRQAEDWAAALPYVYQMKAHRTIIPKFIKGSKFELDHNTGGSTFEAKTTIENGKANVEIVGDFTKASAFDLQARFMGYNFYTLMFRDMYHHIASNMQDWTSKSPSDDNEITKDSTFLSHPFSSITSRTSEAGKYMAKSLIKSAIYMAPAVIPFWAVRIPLDLGRGMILDPEHGLLTAREKGTPNEYSGAMRPDAIHGAVAFKPSFYSSTPSNYKEGNSFRPIGLRAERALDNVHGNTDKRITPKTLAMQDHDLDMTQNLGKYLEEDNFKVDGPKIKRGALAHATGSFSQKLANAEKWVEGKFNTHIYKPNKDGVGTGALGSKIYNLYKNMDTQEVSKVVAKDFVRGSFAYTPYMMAKAETANLYDTPEMDASIYRMLDGVTSLDGAEFRAGMRDIGRVITLNPASKVTQAKVYDGRGIAHSKQRDADTRAKGQGELLTSHHEASKLVAKIKREHEAENASVSNVAEDTKVAADKLTEDITQKLPDSLVSEKNSWQRLHVAKEASQDGHTPPPGATIH